MILINGVSPEGHNWGPINLDAVGKGYIAILIVWSLLVFAGLFALHINRHLSFIRMRNTRLTIAAVLTIHVYLSLVFLVYPLNGSFPCDAEYWIMSIYLPFGIALFQAQNLQLLSLSSMQKKLMLHPQTRPLVGRWPRGIAELRKAWRHMNLMTRLYTLIGAGMVVQAIAALIIFMVSRKFHNFGVVSHDLGPTKCRTGWEWLPSILWQFLWAWGFGPFVLFKIRHIKDIHMWRLQTSLCIISGLPGSPLWMASVYSPAFGNIGKYWPPAVWFAPGLMMMESVSIFFPLIEIYQSKKFHVSTRAAIDEWEKKRQGLGTADSSARTISTSHTSSSTRKRPDMYSMQALEKCLATDPTELLRFAAMKEFTGENIVFLTQVRDWKAGWLRLAKKGSLTTEARLQLFNEGADIFAQTVSLQTSPFPVNLESKAYFNLERMFGQRAGTSSSNDSDIITPFARQFASDSQSFSNLSVPSQHKSNSQEYIVSLPAWEQPIPEGFNEHVFDSAEKSVRYMVFTNTWAKFCDSQETLSVVSAEGARSNTSSFSFLSRLTKG
ncbi:hypothetical protein FGG08_006556 [Glutinoglossum americanum]|uniref:RGS domain-containing protein n=1 Tax=Glutinoglossum americanum TaxID=1670608 RepID=A0A9P8HW23_9PEZI|nr:hypothetical protein FGG08_006556 [Glutinoglossum americanum]